MFALLPLTAALLCSGVGRVAAADEYQPYTWAAPLKARDAHPTATILVPIATIALEARQNGSTPIQPGQINCRFRRRTYDVVNYYTCTELATTYSMTVEEFFLLNPSLTRDCSNVAPNTEYCIRGCKISLPWMRYVDAFSANDRDV